MTSKTETPKETKPEYIILPRGGYLVDTPGGYIQFGSPPETIKDTMLMEKGVPRVFVLSNELFSWKKGISIAEVEFPVYYNFFFKKEKTTIICREKQFRQIKNVLEEAIFGPKKLDISSDFNITNGAVVIPDLKKEMDYFRNNMKLSDIMSFGLFKNDSYTYKGIKIVHTENNDFTVTEKNREIASVPGKMDYKPTYKIGERLPEPYKPPLFGVTCLGPSHGFDPEENTSGYIIWLNHQGIMVDPPVNSTEWLEDSNVNPKLIDSIILTHCHADHDAGTFQKILEEGKVTIYTTETVLHSFLRKYSSLTDVSISYLKKLFNFHPLKIGKSIFIHGGKFNMFYTLHSIPAIGFKMEFQDQSFVYSSDHNNDPEIHNKLLELGAISRERYDELHNFPWDSKVIYHESGVPPLHTPAAFLNSLPKEVQKKTVVYHIAEKDFPEKTSLTLAKFGIENTLYFETRSPFFEKTYQLLALLKNLDFMNEIDVSKVQEFFTIVEEEVYRKGDLILRKGSPGDKFFIIYSGNISVDSEGLEQNKIYGTYEYFGEVALLTGQERAADVYAETDVVVYTIEREKFLNFIAGSEFEKTLNRLVKIRNSETWNLLSTSNVFKQCTSSQKTWLESIFIPIEKTHSDILIKEGNRISYIYIINSGEVEVTKKGQPIARLKRGDFIGSFQKVHKKEPEDYTFSNTIPVSLYAVKAEDILKFVESNPGLLMKIVYDF
ncbi:MAG: cAMP/cGMP-dependent 3',5'-cyclic-AMP/GMP phosphodiesterase [bacterium]|nr:cAMP/cGMP-dependent 3',5'-cyclic-AMP/GMP phosphodiesterase [bacterium]